MSMFKIDDLAMHEDYKYPITIAKVFEDGYYEIRCSNVYGGITFRMVHADTLSEVEKTVEEKLRMAHEEIDMLKRERDDLMIKVQRLQGRNRYLMAPIQRRESPGNWMHVSHFVALLGKWGFAPLVPDVTKEMRYALLIDTFAEILQLQKWYDNGDDKEIRKSFDKVTRTLIEIGAFDAGDKRDIDFQDWDELIPKCYVRIIQFVKGERNGSP